MTAIIGKKIGMTQITNSDGIVCAITLIKVPENFVTKVNTVEKNGYDSIQIGVNKTKKTKKSVIGELKKNKISENTNFFKEIKGIHKDIGDEISLSEFKTGDVVTVEGISKGKGFAGTIKRHGFTTGPKTHGSHNYRAPGSIGSAYPQRVVKGKKMAGRMGASKVTMKNLRVMDVLEKENLIALSGNVPGPSRGYVLIKKNQ